jgi:ubiquinone/menaquinone biosynthesis C-methylase UbiE
MEVSFIPSFSRRGELTHLFSGLPIEIAARTGKAYSIEPNADRNSIQAVKAQESGVEIANGSAENIPYGDGFFDAVVAMWVMHYVDDLDKSLRELVRVANPEAPNARIVIVHECYLRTH